LGNAPLTNSFSTLFAILLIKVNLTHALAFEEERVFKKPCTHHTPSSWFCGFESRQEGQLLLGVKGEEAVAERR